MDEADKKLFKTLNKKKKLRKRKFLISNIVVTTIVVTAIIIFAINIFLRYKNNRLDHEMSDDEKERKGISVLSEDIVGISSDTYEFKDIKKLTNNIRKTYKDESGLIKGNKIYIKEGVYELELSGEQYGVIWLKDKLGEQKLSANFNMDDGHGGSFMKITEAYLTPGMTLEVKKDHRQTTEAKNLKIHIRRLNKELDQDSIKEGKTYELKEKEVQEFYRVGKDIPSGIYDVELIEGKGGIVRIHDEEKDSQQTFLPASFQKVLVVLSEKQKLFKDIYLNDGDRIFLVSADESKSNKDVSKYKFIAK